jgi:HEAT repeat protein
MIDQLITSLSSASPADRMNAAEALARMGVKARDAAVPLVRATGDQDTRVRDWAVAALEELGPPRPGDLELLTALAAHADLDIAYWSCTLLGRLKADAASAADALSKVLATHEQLCVQERAAWALGQIGPSARSALPALEQAAQSNEPRLSRLAQQAIDATASHRAAE